MYGDASGQARLQSDTADSVTWSRYFAPPVAGATPALIDALSRVEFVELQTPVPLHAVVNKAASQFESLVAQRSRLLIVVGRSRRLAVENHRKELSMMIEKHGSVGHEVKKTIGDVATAFVVSGCKASLVVIQAANTPAD